MKIWKSKILSGSTFLVASLMMANILNFVFNAYLGRNLSLGQFGLVTFVNTITYILNIVLVAVSSTIIHRVAYINSQSGPKEATLFFKKIERSIFIIAIVGTLVFILLSPFLTKIFHIHTVTVLLYMSPAIIATTMGALNRAYLQGRLLFVFVGLMVLLEPILKLLFSIVLVNAHQKELIYISIPLAGFITAIVTVALVFVITKLFKFKKEELQKKMRRFLIDSLEPLL